MLVSTLKRLLAVALLLLAVGTGNVVNAQDDDGGDDAPMDPQLQREVQKLMDVEARAIKEMEAQTYDRATKRLKGLLDQIEKSPLPEPFKADFRARTHYNLACG